MFDYSHYMGGMHWFWWLFWIVLIVAAWWTFSRRPSPSAPPPPATPPADAPPDRLQRRYADGEITTEEYEERKAILLRDR